VFPPGQAAMWLDWSDCFQDLGPDQWYLPGGVLISGAAPSRFGILVHRQASDDYAVRLVWNNTHLAWPSISRQQLLDSCLGLLLAALATDLHNLLDQPVDDSAPVPQAECYADVPTGPPIRAR